MVNIANDSPGALLAVTRDDRSQTSILPVERLYHLFPQTVRTGLEAPPPLEKESSVCGFEATNI